MLGHLTSTQNPEPTWHCLHAMLGSEYAGLAPQTMGLSESLIVRGSRTLFENRQDHVGSMVPLGDGTPLHLLF